MVSSNMFSLLSFFDDDGDGDGGGGGVGGGGGDASEDDAEP